MKHGENFVKRWKRIKAVFILKQGKYDYESAKSFGPISLSSFMLKGLERVTLWYIQSSTLRRNALSNIFSHRGNVDRNSTP